MIPQNLKELFDALISQGGPSVTNDPGEPSRVICAYRGNDKRKCAAGHLIPDDRYRRNMEGISIEQLLRENKNLIGSHWAHSKGIVRTAQEAHDLAYTDMKHGANLSWPDALRDAWKKKGLPQ